MCLLMYLGQVLNFYETGEYSIGGCPVFLCFCICMKAGWGGSVILCICRACIICVFGTKCIGVIRCHICNVLGNCGYIWGLWRGVVCMSLCVYSRGTVIW